MPQHRTRLEQHRRSQRFVRRIHGMRVLGTALCTLPIASILAERDASIPLWVLLALNALVWPQLAYHFSLRARDPVAAQFRCLSLDSAFAGAWVAVMALSVAPSALFISLATADKIAAGGWPLLRRSTPALLGGFALAWTLLGFPYQPGTSMRTLLLTIPYLFLYLVALSVVMYRLGSRIAEQKRELVRLNRTDPTMQLPNRPYFEEVAAAELARAHRAQHPVSLLLIDVDRFKTINDRYGHGMGDVVLKRVAGLLRDSVRGADLPARYGGDEFAVLLVDADARRAVQVAERIRREAEAQVFDAEPGLRCTLSIGVAQAAADDADLDSWIRAADAALYRAKAAGRNRVAGAGGTRT